MCELTLCNPFRMFSISLDCGILIREGRSAYLLWSTALAVNNVLRRRLPSRIMFCVVLLVFRTMVIGVPCPLVHPNRPLKPPGPFRQILVWTLVVCSLAVTVRQLVTWLWLTMAMMIGFAALVFASFPLCSVVSSWLMLTDIFAVGIARLANCLIRLLQCLLFVIELNRCP